MPRFRKAPSAWTTNHTVEDESFEFKGRWYHVRAEIAVTWLDDSDYDRERGYGQLIEADEVEVEDLKVSELDPDSGDVLCEVVSDAEVLKAAESWAEEQGGEQDHRE
jgi:hypothetical protein